MVLLSLIFVVIAIVTGLLISRHRFKTKIQNLSKNASAENEESIQLSKELSRIDELKRNLVTVQHNVESLDFPLPEQLSKFDTTQTTLNKLSAFLEKHNLAVAGSEQVILSVLPVSQIGQSLSSMCEVLPSKLGEKIFGDAFASVKDGIHPDSVTDFLGKFIHGASHLSHNALHSMSMACEHHNYFSAAFTPIKSGLIEASGLSDAGHNIVHSIQNLGSDIFNAAESCSSVGDLASTTDFDVTGHVPVITIALSSFREYQLLAAGKTNVIVSLQNISLDTIGTGGGALAGAKAGAIIGSAFTPIGTIIGALIGGVIGGICGRSITNKLKLIPLKHAIKKYEINYNQMKSETEAKSKQALSAIRSVAEIQREGFKKSKLLHDMPIVDTSNVVSLIALSIYKCIVDETIKMKSKAKKLRRSIWYSEKRHGTVIATYEKTADDMLAQMPLADKIQTDPKSALNILIRLNIPTYTEHEEFQKKIAECRNELKELNDKNDSSLLMWSYMVNNLYKKTLNDIAAHSNEQMQSLDKLFSRWKKTMDKLSSKVEKEKGRLGLV